VVAAVVRELGFHIGDDLNRSLDNLWFTLLFKRPAWYRRDARGLDAGVSAFRKAMTGCGSLSPRERAFVLRATLEMAARGHDRAGYGRGAWALRRARSLSRATRAPAVRAAWAWKEPNTHVLLEPLTRSLDGLRYIHTIRHGVEMAYSSNQGQLFNWGPLFGVEPPRDPAALARASLRYWVRANTRALEQGPRLLGDRFLVLRYESVCADPRSAIRQLAGFLDVRPDERTIERLGGLVNPRPRPARPAAGAPPFAPDDLAATERLGFEL
jgi:hypothetical protein